MKYLFKYSNKYFDINNNEVIVNDNLHAQIDTFGFEISQLKTLTKDFIINKQLLTCRPHSSVKLRLSIKNNSHRFILLKLDKEYKNLIFNSSRKTLVSNDGITWRCYQDINSYSEEKFNISLNNLNTQTLNDYDKKELLSMICYTTNNSKSLDVVNTTNAKYMFIEIYDFIDKICDSAEYMKEYSEKKLIVTANKDVIKIQNADTTKINKLTVQLLQSSNKILNTLKEF